MTNQKLSIGRKISLSIATAAVLAITTPQALSAATNNTIIEQLRAEKVVVFKDNLDNMRLRIENYILQTGDYIFTLEDVKNYYSLPANYFNNFGGVPITFAFNDTTKQITFTNALGTNPNSFVIQAFLNDSSNERILSNSNNYSANYALKIEASNFVDIIKKVAANADIVVSSTAPLDTLKTWYEPDSKGGFNVYKYQNGQWAKIGSTGTSGKIDIIVNSLQDLETIACADGDKGYVAEGDVATSYICATTGWKSLSSSNSGGGTFNGTGNIVAMATTLFTKAGGSIVDSQAPNAEWGGSKTFTKKDDTTTGGYWKTDDNAYVVTNTIGSLNALSSLFTEGTTAWIANGSSTAYKLQKKTLPNAAIAWVYVTKDYGTLLSFDTAASANGDGVYIFVTDHSEYFYYSGGVFNPHPSGAGITYTSKDPLGRSIFSPLNAKTYLIQSNDCTDLTCNGTIGTSYYAGSQIDGLYAYYYSTTGKYKNYLTDATPYTSWATFWADAASAVQWNGAQFGEVPTGAILTKNTLNGAIVYSYNNNYINKSNGYIIPQNKLPAGLVASTATITQSGGKNYVNVTTLDTFITDTNLAVGYTVNLTGSGFTNKLIERCSNYSDGSQWSDLCTNIAASTVAISNESRSDLTAPSSSSRVNLTKTEGTEPNYTTTGVTYTADAGYKQWFYSTSGTITNAMLDAIIPTAKYATTNGNGSFGYIAGTTVNAYLDATAKSVGYAYLNGIVAQYSSPYWKPITDSTKILSGDFVTQFSTTTSNIGGVAANGLIYTDTNTPFNTTYRIDTQFGVTTWSTAEMNSVNPRGNTSNICETRGMLLPRLDETTGSTNPWGGLTYVPAGGSMGNANGVPSHTSGYTWTASSFTSGTSAYWIWSGTNTTTHHYTDDYYVRCVR